MRWLTKKKLSMNPHPYWRRALSRFKYIKIAINVLKQYKPTSILEIGPGPNVRIADGATTVDIDPANNPDIVKDITQIPWNLGVYDCVVALQVFEHLKGKQKTVFKEAYNTARKCLIISIPYKWTKGYEGHIGLDDTTMLSWSNLPWDNAITVGCRRLYIWSKT